MADLWNEHLYNEVIQSDGFVPDFAVFTTYSLDLPSLLSLPFSLGAMSDIDEDALKSPHLVLEAISNASRRFAVFCNAGCIAVPQSSSRLFSLLEKCVVQVALPAAGAGFVNFHPKVWIIRETNPDTALSRVKVVVLSRNITASDDLDVVCALTGDISPAAPSASPPPPGAPSPAVPSASPPCPAAPSPGAPSPAVPSASPPCPAAPSPGAPSPAAPSASPPCPAAPSPGAPSPAALEKHRPLMDFISWLADRAPVGIARKMRDIVADIANIQRFSLDGSPFADYDFFPMGIDGYDGFRHCFDSGITAHAAEMVVISPFIDRSILASLAACSPAAPKTLITRHSSVTQEILGMFSDGVYAPKEVLTDTADKDVSVDLHEKVYFIRTVRDGKSVNDLYLGSANATRNAFGRNVEFLLRLTFGPYRTSYAAFRHDLVNDRRDCMFERVLSAPEQPPAATDCTDELLLRRAIAEIDRARVKHTPAGYDITVYCHGRDYREEGIFIHPLGCEAMETLLADGVAFRGLDLKMLTEFHVVRIGTLKRIVKIDTPDLPVDLRDKAVFRSLVDTPGKFIGCVAFMLSDDKVQYLLEKGDAQDGTPTPLGTDPCTFDAVSLYEDMVRMAYTDPSRLAAIRSVMDKAGPEVVPLLFKDMFARFESALRQLKKRDKREKRQ